MKMEMFRRGEWDPLCCAASKMIVLILIPTAPQTYTSGRVMETSVLYFANLRLCCYHLLIICKNSFCCKGCKLFQLHQHKTRNFCVFNTVSQLCW